VRISESRELAAARSGVAYGAEGARRFAGGAGELDLRLREVGGAAGADGADGAAGADGKEGTTWSRELLGKEGTTCSSAMVVVLSRREHVVAKLRRSLACCGCA